MRFIKTRAAQDVRPATEASDHFRGVAALADDTGMHAAIVQPGPQNANQAPTFSAPALQTRKVSTTADGSQLDGYTYSVTPSPDGTRLVFTSQATNVVPGDVNGFTDLFIKNLVTGEVSLVSRTATGQQTNDHNGSPYQGPIFSADGSKLMFDTLALNMGAEYVSGQLRGQVVIKDLVTGAVTRVSETADGTPSNLGAFAVDLSADGTKVLLYSVSTNLVPNDTNDAVDMFVKDLITGVVTRVSTGAAGEQSNYSIFLGGEFSPDGTRVVFVTFASNLVAGDTNSREDIFVKNLATGAIEIVSRSAGGTLGDGSCFDPHFSPDGTKVLFSSYAGNLVAGDTNGAQDIFIKDLTTGAVTRVSSGPSGEQYFNDARDARFSPDGTKVVFIANGSQYPGDTNGHYDVFVKNLISGAVTWITTLGEGGGVTNSFSQHPFFVDNETVGFESLIENLVAGDTNFKGDIFTSSPVSRYVENAVPLQVVSVVNVGDGDSANYAGGTLTIAITAGAEASDRLVFTPNSIGPGFGLELVGTDVRFRSASVGTLTKTDTSYSIVLKDTADDEAVQAMVKAASIYNISENPSAADRIVTFTLVDGGGTVGGGQDSASFIRTIKFLPVDDPTISRPDILISNSQVLTGNLFANNGFGADTDVDSALIVAAVNGASVVGQTIALASGALLTVNANGNFTYDRNTAFANGMGAIDTFTYRPPFGETVAATIQIAGTPQAIVTGTPGPDVLASSSLVEEIFGLGGDDVYLLDHVSDIAREAVGGGFDTVYVDVSHSLAAGSEVEILSTRVHAGTGAINLIGNEFAQTLVGNAGANVLNGGGGADVMAGLAGDDTYVVDRIEDQVLEGVGQGTDAVFTSVSYVLSSNQEIETLSTQTHAGTDDLFLTGNQLNNILVGNAGDNIMNGVGGADVMYGLAGDDTYAIDNLGDLVIDGFGQGNDLVLTYLSHTLSNGNEIETLSTVFHQGTTAIDLGGNDYNNTLIGNYGANYINGNGGVDVMIGLNGNDTYVAENALDVVQEVAGGGSDVLFSFVSYALAAGQEVETISTALQGGTTAIALTGNEVAQTVIGNAGANLLDGKGGSDTLYGLGGADTFAFTTALGAGNVDTIADFVAGSDRIGLDDAIFTAIGGTLNASAFVIGTAAADADDRIIYNSTTGALFYDADGNGAGAAVQFATLSGAPALAASDFAMI